MEKGYKVVLRLSNSDLVSALVPEGMPFYAVYRKDGELLTVPKAMIFSNRSSAEIMLNNLQWWAIGDVIDLWECEYERTIALPKYLFIGINLYKKGHLFKIDRAVKYYEDVTSRGKNKIEYNLYNDYDLVPREEFCFPDNTLQVKNMKLTKHLRTRIV